MTSYIVNASFEYINTTIVPFTPPAQGASVKSIKIHEGLTGTRCSTSKPEVEAPTAGNCHLYKTESEVEQQDNVVTFYVCDRPNWEI